MTFTLGAVLAALAVPSASTRTAIVLGLACAALASKETAVILPVLVGLSLWLAHGRDADYRSLAPVLALAIIYAVWRVVASDLPASHRQLPSGYELKELLGRPFAALALPYHETLLAEMKGVPAIALALLPISAGALALRGSGRQLAVLGWAIAWTLVSVAPLSTAFFVGADLQGSRYVYLASAGWSIALPFLIPSFTRWKEIGVTGMLLVACAAAAGVVRFHLGSWVGAGVLRDRVVAAYATASARCEPLSVSGLPDTNDGAYVFRNGFPEAVRLLAPRSDGPSNRERPPCSFQWTGAGFAVADRGGQEP